MKGLRGMNAGKIRPMLVASLGAIMMVALSTPAQAATNDIHTIKHVIIIMQENRSFDTYFGTYPGADGIPMQNGVPTVCVPDTKSGQCVKPFHDSADVNLGGPHAAASATADIDGGKMDGFIDSVGRGRRNCKNPDAPGGSPASCVKARTVDNRRQIL
jgi:phospholipase C